MKQKYHLEFGFETLLAQHFAWILSFFVYVERQIACGDFIIGLFKHDLLLDWLFSLLTD